MRLFHGSTVTVKRPNIQKGRKATDFGKGFYTTTNFEQAKKMGFVEEEQGTERKKQSSLFMKFPMIFLIGNIRFFGLWVRQKNGWSLLSTTAEEEKTVTMT